MNENEVEKNILQGIKWLQYLDEDKDIITSVAFFQAMEQLKEDRDFDNIIRIAADRFHRILNKVGKARDMQDYIDYFKFLELNGHFSGTSPLFPEFVLLPPSILLNKKKISSKYTSITKDGMKFFNAGIIPLDWRIAEKIIPNEILSEAGKPKFVDVDYFLLIEENAHNFFLGIGLMATNIKEFPSLVTHKEEILNIGSIRAHRILNKNTGHTKDVLEPITYDVSTRDELDRVLKKIEEAIIPEGFEMWFRGQPSEYFLSDMVEESKKKFIKYRNVRDCCLWPSLYRNVQGDVTDIQNYAKKCASLDYFSYLMSHYLDLDKNEVLNSTEEPVFNDNSLENFERPLRYQVVQRQSDGSDDVKLKQMNPVATSLRKVLFLQHYGLPTNILDITNNIDVALFFSQMKIFKNSYVANTNRKSVIYLFLLNPKTDMMLNSGELLKRTSLLRPQRQHCGILYGASMVNRNHYARYISIKINLKEQIKTTKTTNELFPNRVEDHFLDFIFKAKEKNIDSLISPFDPS